jgi:predicted nucleic acid-binding protein
MNEFDLSSRVYVDSNIFIYFIEKHAGFLTQVRSIFDEVSVSGGVLLTSELTLAEWLCLPARQEDLELVALYLELFETSGDVEQIALTGQVAKQAAMVAGQMKLKLLDAIHYVSALNAGCTHFLSADAIFKVVPSITVIHIAP